MICIKKLAALDCDGNITLADALEVLRYSVGLLTKSNVREIFFNIDIDTTIKQG